MTALDSHTTAQTQRIEIARLIRDAEGNITYLVVYFGPHHFLYLGSVDPGAELPPPPADGHVEMLNLATGPVQIALGSPTHAFWAFASDAPSELDRMVEHILHERPDRTFWPGPETDL